MSRRNFSPLFLLALLAGLVLGTAPVHAHDTLVGVSPEDGSQIEVAPDQAVLTFSGQPLDVAPQAIVQKDGEPIETEPVSLDGYDVIVPLPGLEAGNYTIIYSIVSSDGHRIDGSTTFEVTAGQSGEGSTDDRVDDAPDRDAPAEDETPGDTPVSSEETETDGSDGNVTDSDEVADDTSADAAEESDSGSAATWIRLAGIVIVILGGTVLFLRARRNRSS